MIHNGTLNTPLLKFYLELVLVCSKKICSVEITMNKWLNYFVQSTVESRRQDDENPISIVIAETMKLLANNSNSLQINDRR